MIHANQQAYDNASEPSLDDYQKEEKFSDFVEHVALELLAGSDCMGIDSQIFMIDLKLAKGGYQMAREWVCDRVTEEQYREWVNG